MHFSVLASEIPWTEEPGGIQSMEWLALYYIKTLYTKQSSSFPGGSDGKESACEAGHPGLIQVREGNGNPLQYSCLENPMNRGAWQAAVHRVA